MKKLLLTTLLAVASSLTASAQTYQAITDTIWAGYYLRFYDGRQCQRGNTRNTDILTSWPTVYRPSTGLTEKDIDLVYYIHLPAGYVDGTLTLTTRAARNPQITATLTRPSDGEVLFTNTCETERGVEQELRIIPDFNVPEDGWYQLMLSTEKGKDNVSKVNYIVFKRESKDVITAPWTISALSVYLSGYETDDKNAPSGQSYDWTYMEMKVPSEYDRGNSYWCAADVIQGYYGIQTTINRDNFWCDYPFYHNTIFSIWDNGDTEANKNLPEYFRSGPMAWGDDVKIARFGNEGTGSRSMRDGGQHWETDKWMQFLFSCRPQDINITLKNSAGEDSVTIVYPTTVVSLFYKMEDETEWRYHATQRASGSSKYVDSWYSFIENWSPTEGYLKRRAYYRNVYRHSLASGKWSHCNSVGTGKYNNSSAYRSDHRDRREDFDMQSTTLEDAEFYMETGGFDQFNDFKDKRIYTTLNTDNTCVDTINLDRQWQVVLNAFTNEKANGKDEILGTSKNLDFLKAIAADYIAHANQFEYYSDDDLAEVISVYNDGNCTDASALYDALANVITTAKPLVYSTLQKDEHIGTFHAYQLYNTNGLGIVCAKTENGESSLYAAGATDDSATGDAKELVDVTNNLNNWILVRPEPTGQYYLYNIGLGKYLDLSKSNYLSDTPVALSLGSTSNGYSFQQGKNYLAVQPSSADNSVTAATSSGDNTLFELRDNVMYQPSTLLVESVINETKAYQNLRSQVSYISRQLNLPEGVVGYITNDDDRARVKALYDSGITTLEQLDEAQKVLESVERVEFQPTETAYRLYNIETTNSAKPYMASSDAKAGVTEAANKKPYQIWTFQPSGNGYKLSSQGVAPEEIAQSDAASVALVETKASDDVYLTNQGYYNFSIGNAADAAYGLSVSGGSIVTGVADKTLAQWYLEPINTCQLYINAAGMAALCIDLDVVLPEGLTAYTATAISDEGVITLKPITDERIPAGTPMLLTGTAKTYYDLTVLPASGKEPIQSLLTGTLLKQTDLEANSFYTLRAVSGKSLMKPSSQTYATANTAYIVKTSDMPDLSQYTFEIDNTTGIGAVNADGSTTQSRTYDLQGRPATQSTHGIVIKDGKKIVNK